MKGLRFNKNKIDLTYCPTSAIAAVALTLMKNSDKYGGKYPDNNWRSGIPVSTYMACVLRHIYKYIDGEDLDSESGIPHLFHAITNLAMAIENVEVHDKADDRHKLKTCELDKFTKKYMDIK